MKRTNPGRLLARWAAALLLVGFVAPAAEARTTPPPRPNILFILVDDLRWDALGITGHPFVKTPHIDRIGREGARFRNAFVTTPLCSPSRASFLTGQYAHTHGIVGNEVKDLRNFAKDDTLPTYARLLQSAGYETAHIGKWHMDAHAQPRPGFDHWVSFPGQGVYNDPTLNINGKTVAETGYMTDILSRHAEGFIRRPHAKPWAMNLWHKAVHGPFLPAPRHKTLFADVSIPSAPSVPPVQTNAEGKPLIRKGRGANDSTIRDQLRLLAAVEESTGAVLRALEETKQLDNTLIVFSSDNGYFWGEHGLGDKRRAYEESLRVPLLMRFPKAARPNTVREQMVLNVDVAPTLLDVAGVPIPAAMQGRSLLPLLLQTPAPRWRDSILTEYFFESGVRGANLVADWQSVRTAQAKLIHWPGSPEKNELFDLRSDPFEMKNRIGEPGAAADLARLRGALEQLKRDAMPAQLPPTGGQNAEDGLNEPMLHRAPRRVRSAGQQTGRDLPRGGSLPRAGLDAARRAAAQAQQAPPADLPRVVNVATYLPDHCINNSNCDATDGIRDAIKQVQKLGPINNPDPDDDAPHRSLYFPPGIYYVTQDPETKQTKQDRWSRRIHVRGATNPMTGAPAATIRLKDNSPAFGNPTNRIPVLSFYDGDWNNIAFCNTIESLAIDVGAGNVGAIGLRFHNNNVGSVRNVVLKSSVVSGKEGYAGLDMGASLSGIGMVKDVSVTGFQYGIINGTGRLRPAGTTGGVPTAARLAPTPPAWPWARRARSTFPSWKRPRWTSPIKSCRRICVRTARPTIRAASSAPSRRSSPFRASARCA